MFYTKQWLLIISNNGLTHSRGAFRPRNRFSYLCMLFNPSLQFPKARCGLLTLNIYLIASIINEGTWRNVSPAIITLCLVGSSRDHFGRHPIWIHIMHDDCNFETFHFVGMVFTVNWRILTFELFFAINCTKNNLFNSFLTLSSKHFNI